MQERSGFLLSPPPHEQSTHQCTNNVANRNAAIVATPTKAISDSKTTRGKLGHCVYSSKGNGSDDNNNRSMLHSAQSPENKRVTETTDTTSIARLLPAYVGDNSLFPSALPAADSRVASPSLYQLSITRHLPAFLSPHLMIPTAT